MWRCPAGSASSFEGFRRIASEQKWRYTHRGPKWSVFYSDDALAEQARFFDHFLKGEENGQEALPPVRLEVRADADTVTSVRREQQWPPAGVTWQLELEIRGRWFYPRNPLTGQFPAFYARSPRGRCLMHLGAGHEAHLAVPVLTA